VTHIKNIENPAEFNDEIDDDIRSLVSEGVRRVFKLSNQSGSKKKNKDGVMEEFRPNIFSGNFQNYKDRM
jgi:hypothetical protein